MTHLDLSKLKLTETNIQKAFESHCSVIRRDKAAREETTCIKNVKFKVIKTRKGCQYARYF